MKSVNELWGSVLSELKKELTPLAVKTWFDEVSSVLLTDEGLILYCPTDFKRETIEKYYVAAIKKVVGEMMGCETSVRFYSHQEYADYQDNLSEGRRNIRERSRYRFNSFVVGDSNKIAFNSAQYVAAGFDQFCNPLIIHGGSGLGKTHLLNAIVASVRSSAPTSNIVYTRGDMFTNEMVEAIHESTNKKFREKHRRASLFLMDDAQFIGGKKATQEELLNTFDELYASGCSIVLAMDRPPSEMSMLEDRIRNRFEGGLIVEIKEPELETRLEITKSKAAERGLSLSDEDLCFIAENVTGSVRRIEGALNYLNMKIRIEGKNVCVRDVVREMLGPEQPTTMNPQELIEKVGREFGVEPALITGKSKTKNVMMARQVCMYLLCQEQGQTTSAAGKILGRDHSTVVYGIQRVEGMMNADADFSVRVNRLIGR